MNKCCKKVLEEIKEKFWTTSLFYKIPKEWLEEELGKRKNE